jgi:tetratricopeptide (TPR) repeat protein
MGEVYRARDSELERDVAVKVLPEAVAENPDRLDRFRREARAVAKLSHPNILEIWDFGTQDGVTYAVSELLEGQTLRQRVPATGLPWQKVGKIGARIADGLAAAHSKGVVHRDLKPENIFVTSDGRVKVLDFGLARVQEQGSPDEETHTVTPEGTEAGTIMGTVGYMSPEQVTGGQVDHRSDIFSLGCVLFELVSGRRPFEADTEVEVMAAILLEEPPHLSSTGASLPVDLEHAIHRCLEKSPEARFQSAADLAFALRSIGTSSAVPMARSTGEALRRSRTRSWLAAAGAVVVASAAIVGWFLRGEGVSEPTEVYLETNRIVVAPFDNRTGDPSLDTLGIMASDLIVQRFTETAAAEVVPLADVLHATPPAGADDENGREWSDVLERARERSAGLVLSGAYYLDGEALRLQARVVDAATGDLIYAFEPVTAARDAAAEGIDDLRDRVVAAVAAHVNSPAIDIAIMRPPANYEAFQAFARGEELLHADRQQALGHFLRALEMDSDFHRARIEVVYAHNNVRNLQGADHELSLLEQRLDRMTPYEQRYVQYLRSFLDQDLPAALSAIRALVELAPQMDDNRLELALRAVNLNRPAEAIEALEPIVHSLIPSHYQWAWFPVELIADALHMLGDYERELGYAELGIERFPGVANFFYQEARALAAMGRIEEVDDVVNEFLQAQTRGLSAGWLMSRAAIELRAHGHRQASNEMAARSVGWYESHPSAIPAGGFEGWSFDWSFGYALQMVGRLDDLEDHIGRLMESKPINHQLSGWLGVVAAMRGDAERARQLVDEITMRDRPEGIALELYWRAAVAAHLGEKDSAVELLAEAFSKGLWQSEVVLAPEDFEPLWDYPPFQELMKPKG